MGLEQPELESGVDPAAGPRLASPGPAHQAASRRVASGWTGSPSRRSSGSARRTSSGPRPDRPGTGVRPDRPGVRPDRPIPGTVFPATGRSAPARVPTVPERVPTVPRFGRIVPLPVRNVRPARPSRPEARPQRRGHRGPQHGHNNDLHPARASSPLDRSHGRAGRNSARRYSGPPTVRMCSALRPIDPDRSGGTVSGATPAPARRTQPAAIDRHASSSARSFSRCEQMSQQETLSWRGPARPFPRHRIASFDWLQAHHSDDFGRCNAGIRFVSSRFG